VSSLRGGLGGRRAGGLAGLGPRLARLAQLRRTRLGRWAGLALAALLGLPLAGWLSLFAWSLLLPLPAELADSPRPSLRVEDSAGGLLREVRGDDGKRGRALGPGELGEYFPMAMISAEDQRFESHLGVDPWAAARAAVQLVARRRVVSGASTLTMQLARTVRPHPRTLAGKLGEMALALRIERALSKQQILLAYANRVDFGPSLRGLGAASQAYFDKPPASLSLAEAALLAGLPRGPSLYALGRHPELAVRRRNRVLERMAHAGVISADALRRASSEPVFPRRDGPSFGAPHLVQALVSGALGAEQPGLKAALERGAPARLTTTLDRALQRAAEAAALSTVASLASRHVTAAAVIAVENETGDVLAYVGSPDFLDERGLGQNDGVRALRQPGSTLKPFLYGLALEQLGFTAATALPDVELHLALPEGGDYAPRNYDEAFHGPVRLRHALANSLNVPAVWTAHQLGVPPFLERLRQLGFSSLDQDASYYGPGLALGDGEVTLLSLARAYATLARGGTARPLRFVRELAVVRGHEGASVVALEPGASSRVIPEGICAQITDILADRRARRASFGESEALSFPFDVAAKTGTSKGYRDNWAVGYSSEVTVATWVGNFDGSPMERTSGITGAGPLFHAVMEAAMRARPARPLSLDALAEQGRARGRLPGQELYDLARVSICALSGGAPAAACTHRVSEWLPRRAVDELAPCSMHRRVLLERRSGLLAGPGCPTQSVVERDLEYFPQEYLAWARAAGRPLVPTAYAPACPGPAAELADDQADELQITYPHDGARFVLDPDRPRSLQAIEISTSGGQGGLSLEIDGTTVATGPAPLGATYVLQVGDHVLVARGPGGASEPVRIHVRQ
jgi:penicillin-binding protein 1C